MHRLGSRNEECLEVLSIWLGRKLVKEGRDLKNRTPLELNQAMELEMIKIWGCKNIKGATSLAKLLGLARGRRTGLEKSHMQNEGMAMLELASIANCHAHYLISLFHIECYFNPSALLGRKNQSIMVYWCTNTFAQAFVVRKTSGSNRKRATEGATKANSWRHRGRNEDFLAARLRQIFSHPPAFITPQKPFQLYVRNKHWSIVPAHN